MCGRAQKWFFKSTSAKHYFIYVFLLIGGNKWCSFYWDQMQSNNFFVFLTSSDWNFVCFLFLIRYSCWVFFSLAEIFWPVFVLLSNIRFHVSSVEIDAFWFLERCLSQHTNTRTHYIVNTKKWQTWLCALLALKITHTHILLFWWVYVAVSSASSSFSYFFVFTTSISPRCFRMRCFRSRCLLSSSFGCFFSSFFKFVSLNQC